ncbi:hypothetical protein [Arenimonas composti]|uniref:Peptidase M15B domain-containing protein n=1 Tax=Arenimonas composti TR7-09 = DSM 18010 TaxID=1121013 RepID=A0A091BFE6_9GAMM|nr:hypothetical protein [Arenimonas composti]KFN51423.1 hypothetical protein P873_02850 [Arenimonas composti TR7-09 = DSM 18010]
MSACALALAGALAATGQARAPAAAVARPGDVEQRACLQRAEAALTAEARATLRRITGQERRLLALRGYLRSPDLAGRWTWSAQQVADWRHSPDHARALREIARVQERFATLNPGYRLHVNTEVRSVDTQVLRWNDNRSVARAAAALAPQARRACLGEGAEGFVAWLRGSELAVPPNLAVPGLSPHGQGRAFDFQVFRGERLVAGTDSRRIQADWRDGGWAEKLAEAVRISDAFAGPLVSPDEPWHYDYLPPPP